MTMLTITIIVVCMTSPTQIPIEIRTWYDLNAIRDNLGGSYLLMNDLDSATPGYEELASETANQGKGWQPIGTFLPWAETTFTGFEGTFDGQRYEIHDLFIDRPDELGVGLFGEVGQEGVIKDIGVVNATVTGNVFAGTLVGWNHGAVRDSYSTGNMTGDDFVGGLVGDTFAGTVSNSYSTGSVTGDKYVGGLVGENSGNVTNSYATGSVSGNFTTGGLVGLNYGPVSDSYSTGSVTGSGDNVGGLVGSNIDLGTVSNSYSTGSVTGNNCTGGLVGRNEGTVSNSYSIGSVSGSSYVGGLVGSNEVTVTNSFWDTETSEQATSDGGTGKNTTQMKDIATFSGVAWNITVVAPGETNSIYIWNIVNNITYPFLSWHNV
jgi:hypothetical protein